MLNSTLDFELFVRLQFFPLTRSFSFDGKIEPMLCVNAIKVSFFDQERKIRIISPNGSWDFVACRELDKNSHCMVIVEIPCKILFNIGIVDDAIIEPAFRGESRVAFRLNY